MKKTLITVITFLALIVTSHSFAQDTGGDKPAKSGKSATKSKKVNIYNAPDLISKTSEMDARNTNGTFKITTLENGVEIRRMIRPQSRAYLVIDKNGNTLPSSVIKDEDGCFLCWNNGREAVRIKCAQ